jgi:hypothetical protein
MVRCQESPPLKGSKHSQQCHHHDAALVNALSFVSMGVEARCCPCHSTAHCRHMKRQPCLCHRHSCHGRCHSDRRHHLCHHRQLPHHHRCHCPSPSPSAIAVAIAIDHRRRPFCCVTISHGRCRCHCPCHRPLPSLSPSAIAVTISVGHHCHRCCWPFPRVVALVRQELYSTN